MAHDLGRGEQIWMLAMLPGHIRVKNTADITEKYLLLHNSHDGTSSLRCHFTPIRVVCANTLSIAERGGRGQGISIMHKGDLAKKVQEAQELLGLANRFYDDVQTKVDFLATRYPTRLQLAAFFKALYPDPVDANNTRAKNIREQLARLFEEGQGQDIPGIRRTSWAALHAVTEYVDHFRSTRGHNDLDRASRRLQSQWFGSGARLKARAWDLALQMTAG